MQKEVFIFCFYYILALYSFVTIVIFLNSTKHTFYEWEFSVCVNLVASTESKILAVLRLIFLAAYTLSTLFLFLMSCSFFTFQTSGC